MRRAIKIITGITLVVIAYLLHNFYISYHYARENFIVSWTASRSEYDAFISEYAKSLVHQDEYRTVEIPSPRERFEQRKRFIREYCTNFRRDYSDKLYDYSAQSDPEHYTCRKKWVEPKFVKEKVLARKGVSLDEAVGELRRIKPSIRKGMTPSEVSAGKIPSRTAMARSLWLGIILPVSLLVAGVILIAVGLARNGKKLATHGNPTRLGQRPLREVPLEAGDSERYESRGQHERPKILSEVLKQHFGKDLGVAGGSAKREDPLVITETVDYVSIEYAVAKFLMQGQEYKKEKQQLHSLNGRKVDELVFATKSVGASEWESIRRFYFDITDGFSQLGK